LIGWKMCAIEQFGWLGTPAAPLLIGSYPALNASTGRRIISSIARFSLAPRLPVCKIDCNCALPRDVRVAISAVAMGIFRKTLLTGTLTAAVTVGYLGQSTTLVRPLPPRDPIFRSKPFKRFNIHKNPLTQDVCLKRVPLDKVRPELLEPGKEADLVLEFCRGVWSGLGKWRKHPWASRDMRTRHPKIPDRPLTLLLHHPPPRRLRGPATDHGLHAKGRV
jgi:hypothetical protein